MRLGHVDGGGRSVSRVDAGLVGLLVVQLVELATSRPVTVSTFSLTVLTTGPLLVRRRVPLAAVLVSLAAQAALVQLLPNGTASTFFALLVTVAVAGAQLGTARLAGLVGGLAVAAEAAWLDALGGGPADFLLSGAFFGAAWGAGLVVAQRSRSADEAVVRAADAEQRRLAAAREAVAEERSRMTRELHDVVAHGLTVLVVQSVAAQEDLAHGVPVEQILPRLRSTEEVAREALLELRRLLGVLGTDGSEGPGTSVGLTDLTRLVETTRATGLAITMAVHGEPCQLEPAVGLAAHRILQEALTNALRYSSGSADVEIRFGDEALSITVTSVGLSSTELPGTGRGLAGLHERAALLGGQLSAGWSGGTFVLDAVLPMAEPTEVSVAARPPVRPAGGS